MPGDMIIVRETDPSTLQVGDVISFLVPIDDDDEMEIITHRIVEYKTMEDGTRQYNTKGDYNDYVDQDPQNSLYIDPIEQKDIIGVWTGIRIPDAMNMMIYFIIIPAAALFIWQLIVVIRLAFKLHREKQVDMVQAEKDRVIAEYLAEQKAKEEADAKAQANNVAADTADPPSEE